MIFVCPAHQDIEVSFKGTGCMPCAALKFNWRERRKQRRRNAKLMFLNRRAA